MKDGIQFGFSRRTQRCKTHIGKHKLRLSIRKKETEQALHFSAWNIRGSCFFSCWGGVGVFDWIDLVAPFELALAYCRRSFLPGELLLLLLLLDSLVNCEPLSSKLEMKYTVPSTIGTRVGTAAKSQATFEHFHKFLRAFLLGNIFIAKKAIVVIEPLKMMITNEATAMLKLSNWKFQ